MSDAFIDRIGQTHRLEGMTLDLRLGGADSSRAEKRRLARSIGPSVTRIGLSRKLRSIGMKWQRVRAPAGS